MTGGFDWTAWAHGHIEALERENDALQEANAALAARVRELEEAQGELLGLADFWEQTWRRSVQASWSISGLEGIEDAKDVR